MKHKVSTAVYKSFHDIHAGVFFYDNSDRLCLKLDEGYVFLGSPSSATCQMGKRENAFDNIKLLCLPTDTEVTLLSN